MMEVTLSPCYDMLLESCKLPLSVFVSLRRSSVAIEFLFLPLKLNNSRHYHWVWPLFAVVKSCRNVHLIIICSFLSIVQIVPLGTWIVKCILHSGHTLQKWPLSIDWSSVIAALQMPKIGKKTLLWFASNGFVWSPSSGMSNRCVPYCWWC